MQDAKFLTASPAMPGRHTQSARHAPEPDTVQERTTSDAENGYAAEWDKLSVTDNDETPVTGDTSVRESISPHNPSVLNSDPVHKFEEDGIKTHLLNPEDTPSQTEQTDTELTPSQNPDELSVEQAQLLSTQDTTNPISTEIKSATHAHVPDGAIVPPPANDEGLLGAISETVVMALPKEAETLTTPQNPTSAHNSKAGLIAPHFQTIKFGTHTNTMPGQAPNADLQTGLHSASTFEVSPDFIEDIAIDLEDNQIEKMLQTRDMASQIAGLSGLSNATGHDLLKASDNSLMAGLTSGPALGGGSPVLMNSAATLTTPTTAIPPAVQTLAVTTVAHAIATARETAKGVHVQLDPPEMGRVFIDFSFDADRNVTVIVKAEHADTQMILRERADQFVSLLKDSGLDNINLSFQSHHNGQNPDFQQDNQAPAKPIFLTTEMQNAVTQHSSATVRPHPSDGSLDLKL